MQLEFVWRRGNQSLLQSAKQAEYLCGPEAFQILTTRCEIEGVAMTSKLSVGGYIIAVDPERREQALELSPSTSLRAGTPPMRASHDAGDAMRRGKADSGPSGLFD